MIAALLGIDPRVRYGALELSPEQQRAQTLRVLVAELIAQSTDCPVLWVVEDLHWSDATTLELIELCLDQVAGSPIMILRHSQTDLRSRLRRASKRHAVRPQSTGTRPGQGDRR